MWQGAAVLKWRKKKGREGFNKKKEVRGMRERRRGLMA